jgi:hypothetical protein
MKKLLAVILFLVFGVLCFLGGYLYSNLITKRNQSIGEAKKAEYEKKFLTVSGNVIQNTALSLLIIERVSGVWSSAIKGSTDFNIEIREFLEKAKDSLENLKKKNTEIEKGMQDLKNYPIQYQEAYNTLMEVYGVYSQIYSLALFPSGSLMGFNSKTNDLSSEFTKVVSKLKIYMPKLKEEPIKNEKGG